MPNHARERYSYPPRALYRGREPDNAHMKYSVQIVRLLAATAASAVACFFVVAYTHLSQYRFEHEHPDAEGLISGTDFLASYGQWAYGLPIVALLLGILFIRRGASVAFETVLACTWLMSLVWVGGCLLLWLAQNVPIFTHMQWHY